tara:strand:+ start:2487 stop:2852 length:366 start_codon:yes stop_codon:yes gene_type:complete
MNNNDTTYQNQQKLLKVIMLSQLLVEAIDDIKHLPQYRSKVKIHGKTLINLLGPYIKQTKEVNNADPEMANNIYNSIEDLIQKIGNIDLTGIVMINQIHDHYKQFPEDWNEFFKVELQKLN